MRHRGSFQNLRPLVRSLAGADSPNTPTTEPSPSPPLGPGPLDEQAMLAATRRAPHCQTSKREARPRTDHQLAEELVSPEAEEERSIHVSLEERGRIHPVILPVSKLLWKRAAGNGVAGAERGSWHRARSTERPQFVRPQNMSTGSPGQGPGAPCSVQACPGWGCA